MRNIPFGGNTVPLEAIWRLPVAIGGYLAPLEAILSGAIGGYLLPLEAIWCHWRLSGAIGGYLVLLEAKLYLKLWEAIATMRRVAVMLIGVLYLLGWKGFKGNC